MENKVYAVILVGGKGKRLRPLSSNAKPKAFLSVTRNRQTLFKVTLGRAKKLTPAGNILVAANKAHAGLVKKDFPGIGQNLLLEPVSRNTAPAIAWAALELKKRFGDVIAAVLPADQYIKDEKKYIASLKRAAEFAQDNDAIVVLGIKPTFPSTGFGYIKAAARQAAAGGIYKVDRFTEKPDLKTARRFVKNGNYFWNAGGFIFRVNTILGAFKKFAPEIHNNLQRRRITSKLYRNLPDISVDYAVMEKVSNIYCVKGSYGWEDIGSFQALKKVLKKEGRRFVERNGKIVKVL
ncbi:MAG: mannose-1-phosphate guanylyltransferase [Candidatus Omnitrophica bacterium]|nr:mannose-1-phosphate guanylyltransferase [Candidatus Omnitrophota bacterium]